MNDEEKRNAIKIMENLMEHPITKLFHDFKSVESYNRLSQNFFCLSSIKTRLQNNEISNIKEWMNQVELCWSNTYNFQGKNAKYHSIVSTECKKIFEKLTKGINLNSLDKWCSNVYRLQSLQLSFARKPPRKLYPIANHLDSYKQIDNKKIIPLSNAEIKAFMKAQNMIKSEKILNDLVKIIKELQPEYILPNSTQLWLDLTKLDIKTVRALRNCLKAGLEKQGDKYPE